MSKHRWKTLIEDFLGAVIVIATPILLLFLGAAFGLH